MTELKRDIADAMADVMVEQIMARGEYSKDDLLKANFKMEEITRYEALAYGYASIRVQRLRAKNVA